MSDCGRDGNLDLQKLNNAEIDKSSGLRMPTSVLQDLNLKLPLQNIGSDVDIDDDEEIFYTARSSFGDEDQGSNKPELKTAVSSSQQKQHCSTGIYKLSNILSNGINKDLHSNGSGKASSGLPYLTENIPRSSGKVGYVDNNQMVPDAMQNNLGEPNAMIAIWKEDGLLCVNIDLAKGISGKGKVYAQTYLWPHKQPKRKCNKMTASKNIKFNSSISYSITEEQLPSAMIVVSIWRVRFFRKKCVGVIRLPLSELDLKDRTHHNYHLQPNTGNMHKCWTDIYIPASLLISNSRCMPRIQQKQQPIPSDRLLRRPPDISPQAGETVECARWAHHSLMALSEPAGHTATSPIVSCGLIEGMPALEI